jgi:hypothetical protein
MRPDASTPACRAPRACGAIPGLMLAAGLLAAALPAPASAQGGGAPAAPAARAEDVASIDAIITALYASISGPPGQPRDWPRMRSLLLPDARLVPTGRRPDGTFALTQLDVDGFIERSGAQLVEIGFREIEVARRTEQYGNMAHAFSTYDSFRRDETTAYARGINSIQLWNDGARWWILSIYWEGERSDNPIPARYLRGEG